MPVDAIGGASGRARPRVGLWTEESTRNKYGGAIWTIECQHISRRRALIAAAGAAPLLAMGATGAKAAKLSQKAAKYQDSPKEGKQCDGCNLFVAPNACKSVNGAISPKGWCALWIKKAG